MPWMYLRLFGILLLMAAVCLACIWLDIGALPAPYIYAFFWCGSLFPLTLAMFLWELDPFVNISIFEMMGLALLSGVVCVLFGTPVDNSIISGYFAPVWGYVKDSVLMLGVLILVLVCTRKRMYGLGGLALGAAIGAGYALFTMLMASIVDTPIVETPTGLARDFSGLTNAISASVPMLFGNHALWFAPVAGALGLRMNGEKINIRHFADVRVILLILLGFATLMFGMDTMSGAVSGLREVPAFRQLFVAFTNPLLGVLVGAALTAIIQSSSASVGILQALALSGQVSYAAAIPIIMGQNIGTCVTALISSVGTSRNAKRAAIVHLSFNVIGTVIFVIIACCLPLASWVEMLSPGNLKLQIAIVHILFNVTTTALLLPAASWLEKLACLLIKGDGSTAEEMKLRYFDARMLKTPPIAVAQLFNEVQRMGGIAMGNFQRAMECFNEWDAKKSEELARNEDVLDYLNREITDSLVEVKGLDLSEKDTKLVGSMFHVVNDMERIGDHSQNIMESAQLKNQDEVKFSPKAVQELESLSNLVRAQMQRSLDMFKAQVTDDTLLGEVEGVEDEIDTTTEALRSHHMDRLKNHKCSAKNGMIYLDMLTNLERIGDHAENIATSAKSATGI